MDEFSLGKSFVHQEAGVTKQRHYYEEMLGRIYDAATDSNVKPGRFAGCESCYSVTGVCSGYGVTYLPDVLEYCSTSAHQ